MNINTTFSKFNQQQNLYFFKQKNPLLSEYESKLNNNIENNNFINSNNNNNFNNNNFEIESPTNDMK